MVARQAHNLKVVGSIPSSATRESLRRLFFLLLHENAQKMNKNPQNVCIIEKKAVPLQAFLCKCACLIALLAREKAIEVVAKE